MVEVAQFRMPKAGPIAALAFTANGQELLAVYGQEGMLRRWRVADGALETAFDVGPVGMAATSFDDKAHLLAIGAGCTPPAAQAGYDAPIMGTRIWSTVTGNLVHEIDADPEFDMQLSDVVLSSNGNQLAGVEPGSLDVWDTNTGNIELAATLLMATAEDNTQKPQLLRAVAFDQTGEWLAIASEDGMTEVREWDRWLAGDSRSLSMLNSDPEMPLALTIAPSRRWMAKITDKSLYVWDLQSWRFVGQCVLKVQVASGPLAALAFSPDENLLAVGTAGGWQIWSIGDWHLLAQGPQQATYAIEFSPDGRLFVWGDVDGVVHLWDVPE